MRRAFVDSRVRNGSFAVLFFLLAYAQPAAYDSAFPTLRDRISFATTFGDNGAIRLFYGEPHDLLTKSGYTAWRVGGTLAIFSAVWGLLAAVRALRAEEESGRSELVLAGVLTRRGLFDAALVAVGAGAALLWAAVWLGLVAGGLPAGGSAYLALAVMLPALVFATLGALASQVFATRRLAIEVSAAAVAFALLLRAVADIAAGAGWLRWLTPLGWAEEMRAFTGTHTPSLVLALVVAGALVLVARRIAAGRDVGLGVVSARDVAPARLGMLRSPLAHTFREERGSALAWAVGITGFALVMGSISHSFTKARLSGALQREVAKFGGASINTPAGALGLYFLFFVLAISFFACAQVVAARREEADQRLETLFALPVGRSAWLAGRLFAALVGAVTLALLAGVAAWAGAALQGGGVSFADMLGAGANCLPASLLFLSVAALAFAVVPRAAIGISYGLVSVAFVWELIGALLNAPKWTLSLSPFHSVALVPGQAFKGGAAAIMVAAAVVLTALAFAGFRRRDLTAA